MVAGHRHRFLPLVLLGLSWAGPALADGVDAPRQAELRHVIRHDCGACHGMRLTGGLGPALTTWSLRDWPVPVLAGVILNGRPGTPMPAWQPVLSEADAVWIATALKEGVDDAR